MRAASVVSNALGWVIAGQKGVDWERSGLGWEEAWVSTGWEDLESRTSSRVIGKK